MTLMRRSAACLTAALGSGAAMAHGGHGLSGTHWHATDSWGWLALALVIAAAVWTARRK